MVILVALIYRADERSSIKSYIFQMGNYASERIGNLQDINNISSNNLRNKLIAKYVSEYFKVIPDDADVKNRPVLKDLSDYDVFDDWKKNEAEKIAEMSKKKMFRMVRVSDDGIAPLDTTNNTATKTSDAGSEVYYIVQYNTWTWQESNVMKTEPIKEQNSVVLGIKFEPGLREKIRDKKINIKKYLQDGKNPAGLFKFKVKSVIDKAL